MNFVTQNLHLNNNPTFKVQSKQRIIIIHQDLKMTIS